MAPPLSSTTGFLTVVVMNVTGFIRTVWSAITGLLTFLISNIQWIALGVALIGIGLLWAAGNDSIPETLEFIWRCEIFPLLEIPISLLEPLELVWNELICWWNAIGLFNDLIGKRIVKEVLSTCPNEFSYKALFTSLAKAAAVIGRLILPWFVTGGTIANAPIYPLALELTTSLQYVGFLIECLCANLRILADVIVRTFSTHHLACAIHHLANSVIVFLQQIIAWIFSLLIGFAFLVSTMNLQTLSDIGGAIFDGTGPYAAPVPYGVTERAAAVPAYTAEFGNHLVASIICTIVAEVETGGFDAVASDAAFTACLTPLGSVDRNATCAAWQTVDSDMDLALCQTRVNLRVNWLGWAGALVSLVPRIYGVAIHLSINSGRVAKDFTTQPAGERFATDVWQFDMIWDTLRDPPPQFAPSTLSLFDNTVAYNNLTVLDPLPFATCNATDTPNAVAPCDECPELAPRSFESHWCELWRQVDDLLEPVFTVRLFEPLLCCTIGRAVRVVVAYAKFLADLLRALLAGTDRFAVQLLNRDAWEVPFDELVGRPAELGGLIGCLCELVDTIDRDRLHCLCVIIAYPLKAIIEALRIIVLIIPALGNTIADLSGSPQYQPQFPGLTDLFCLQRASTCIDVETHFFKWLRVPRDRTTLFQFINVTLEGGAVVNGTFPEYGYLPLAENVTSTVCAPNTTLAANTSIYVVDDARLFIVDTATNTTLFELVDGGEAGSGSPALVPVAPPPVNTTGLSIPGLPGAVLLPLNVLAGPLNGTVFVAAYTNLTSNGTLCFEVTVIYQEAFVECLCRLLSVEFINAFLTTPIDADQVPDFCCGPRFILRLAVEVGKFILLGIFGLIETTVNVVTGTGGGATVLIQWAACVGPGDGECSPVVEILADLQDLLTCPCLIIDRITIGGNSIPCLCDFIDGLILGTMALLRVVISGAGAIIASVDCAVAVPDPFPEPQCTVLLVERYKRALNQTNLALEFYSEAAGQFGCVIGFVVGFGRCQDQPSGVNCPAPDVVAFGDIGTCGGPIPDAGDPIAGYPDWIESVPFSQVCGCSPLYRFEQLFKRVFDGVALIITIPLDTLIDFLEIQQGAQSPDASAIILDIGNFFQNLIARIIYKFGAVLVGDPCAIAAPSYASINNANCNVEDCVAPFPPPEEAFGIVQHLGFVVNCLFGPTDCASSGACFGDLIVTLGNTLRQLYFLLARLALRFVTLFFALLGIGGPTDFSDAIVGIVEDVFCLLSNLPGLILDIAAVLLNVLATIVNQIIPGAGDILIVILTPILDVLQLIFDLLDTFIDFDAKRSASSSSSSFSMYEVATGRLKRTVANAMPPAARLLFENPALFASEHMTPHTLCQRVVAEYGPAYLEVDSGSSPLRPEQIFMRHLCVAAAGLPPLLNHATSISAAIPSSLLSNMGASRPPPFPPLPADVLYNPESFIDVLHNAHELVDLLLAWQQLAQPSLDTPGAWNYTLVDAWADDLFTVPIGSYEDQRRTHDDDGSTTPQYTALRNHNLSVVHAKPLRSDVSFASFARMYGRGHNPFVGTFTELQQWHQQRRTDVAVTNWNSVALGAIQRIPLAPLKRLADEVGHGLIRTRDRAWTTFAESAIRRAAHAPLQTRALAPPTDVVPRRTASGSDELVLVSTAGAGNTPYDSDMSSRSWLALAREFGSGVVQHTLSRVAGHYDWSLMRDRLVAWHARFAHRGNATSAIAGTLRTLTRLSAHTRHTSLTHNLHQATNAWHAHIQRVHAHTHQMTPADADIAPTLLAGARVAKRDCPDCDFPVGPAPPPPPCNPDVDDCFDCAIIELLVNETIDIFDLCYQRVVNPGNVSGIQFTPTGTLGFPMEPAPGLRTGFFISDAILEFIEGLVGFDLFGSILSFLSNTNKDPDAGPVGIIAFIPLVSRCERELHLQCTYGYGVELGLLAAAIATFLLPLILYQFFPCLAAVWDIVINTVTIWVFFLTVFAYVAWGYNPNCLATPSGTLSSILLPISLPLPRFPECAFSQLRLFIESVLVRCLYTIFPAWLQAGVKEGTPLCPTCPNAIDLNDCTDDAFGFDGTGAILSYLITATSSVATDYLRNTCLVRGGCFFGLGVVAGENTGLLSDFIGRNIEVDPLVVSDAALLECAIRSLPLTFAYLGFALLILLVAIYFWPVVVSAFTTLWQSWRWFWGALTGRRPELPESVPAPRDYEPRPVFYLPPGATSAGGDAAASVEAAAAADAVSAVAASGADDDGAGIGSAITASATGRQAAVGNTADEDMPARHTPMEAVYTWNATTQTFERAGWRIQT